MKVFLKTKTNKKYQEFPEKEAISLRKVVAT